MSEPPRCFEFADLDHAVWLDVQAALKHALRQRHSHTLAAPITLVVHDLLEGAFKAMYRQAFRRVVETDFGIAPADDENQFDLLLKTELAEHGSQNLARYCLDIGWRVQVQVPPAAATPPDVLVELRVPLPYERSACQTQQLMQALGLELAIDALQPGCRVRLISRGDRVAALAAPDLLDGEACRASVGDIVEALNYGVIRFAATGEILAVSPSMLAHLGLDQSATAVAALASIIPLAFHNDIVWGLALAEGNGRFENYRIRVRRHDPRAEAANHEPPRHASPLSVLFNVSGFREADGAIVSLWQVVSRDEGAASMSEGSILSEVRIHNITRNYVPQQVEQKARDAVRLGKTSLTNERRKVAVLFCDVVGFTAYVERNQGNESIIDTLNSILRRIALSVRANHGAIDKFMGDCIMALFESPLDAVLAAIHMQSHSDDINSLRVRAGQQLLQLRIGVHWGEVVIGNVGTAERLDWTAIGDVVNTASRMEKACRPGATLISMDVRQALEGAQPARFRFGEVFGIRVKGKQHALAVCHVSLAGAAEA